MGHQRGWHGYLWSSEEKPQMTWRLLKRVLSYASPYRWKILASLALILFQSGLGLISPLVFRDLIDYTLPAKNLQRLLALGAVLLGVPVMSGVINVMQRRLNSAIGEGVIFNLRVALFAHLQRMSMRFFTHTRVGEMMSRLNNDVVGAQNAISNTLVGIVINGIQAAAVLIVLLSMEWRLTLISVVVLPLFFLLARLMGSRLREITRRQLEAMAQMNALLNETLNIGGALLIKLFGRAQTENDRLQRRAASVRDIGVQRAVMGAWFFMIVGLVSAVGTALIYSIGGYLVIQGVFTVGTIVAFGAYLINLYGSLQGLANAPVEFANSVVSFERVFEVLDLPLEIVERPGAVSLKEVAGKLVFDHVTFQYEVDQKILLRDVERFGMRPVDAVFSGARAGSDKKQDDATGAELSDDEEALGASQARSHALYDVSFEAEPGQLTALVGPSGAGKTTATYLIPRLYDPTQGRILLDGHDLRDVTLESLSEQIGMVTQEAHLFHDTIRTNLLYAKPDASQSELEEAARAANIHGFIMGLPNRYDTIVGERGYRLSGGEKQRVALARVILKNPRILVLDEATSHLDSESEALIQEALKRVMANRTSVVIAHRLSTILAADQILVFDRGRIVERGAHQDLLALDGLYAGLHRTQFNRQQTGAS